MARGSFWSSIAGFTSFVAHAGGPPLNAYLLPLGLSKSIFQGTTVLLFTVINYIKLIPYFWLGQLNSDNLGTSLALLPLAFIGVFIGIKLHNRMGTSKNLRHKANYEKIAFTPVLPEESDESTQCSQNQSIRR